MSIGLVNPRTGSPLHEAEGRLVDSISGEVVAPIRDGIPRFVDQIDNYADNFGYQWNKWENTLSDTRTGLDEKRQLILDRTKFDQLETSGKTILECGMGGGDDTEILLTMPFAEVYSFDYSNSVDRAAKHLKDPRLHLLQASIFDIPFPDRSFDFVFCHRVLQHTPDPEGALRAICRKVKPGGVLFAHSYNKSLYCLMHYRYKYMWFTKRLNYKTIEKFLNRFGPALHRTNEFLAKFGSVGALFSHNFIPFERFGRQSKWRQVLDSQKLYELGELITFDALTPQYDKPMSWRTMEKIIKDEGFTIYHAQTSPRAALVCTAIRAEEP